MPLASQKESRIISRNVLLVLCLILSPACIVDSTNSQTNNRTNSTSRETSANVVSANVQPSPNAQPSPSASPAVEGGQISDLSAATRQNLLLSYNLEWTFGGKSQRGWYLYTSLIGRLLGTEERVDSNEFPAALARWQRGAGLTPSGVLNVDTLYKMVAVWQSRRIKERVYPSPDQLIAASTAELYDPQRPLELRQVEREAYAAYKRMLAAAIADKSLGLRTTTNNELAPSEKYLKIVSAFRSREYQEQLRRQSPNSGRAGLAVNSPHFTGRALDLYVGGDPVETADANRAIQVNTPAYKWLVKNAENYGFHPYYYEPWHWEYIPQEAK